MAGLLLAEFLSPAQALSSVPDDVFQMSIDAALTRAVSTMLPESSNVDGAFLNPAYDPNILLGADAQVSVTFVSEGAGYRNTLGYVLFTDGAFDGLTKSDVDTNGNHRISLAELDAVAGTELGLLFPNASAQGSGGDLAPGDTVFLNDGNLLSAGTSIGFFLIQNAWTGHNILGWDVADVGAQVFYSIDHLNPEAAAAATIGDPGANSRHVAMMHVGETILLGFEDLVRPGGDNDFNDAVFFVSATPGIALAPTDVFRVFEPQSAVLLLIGFAAALHLSPRRRRVAPARAGGGQ
ncbi:MAG: DUF4114 domain-containing protein [Rhodobacterales bacterium]|nr:DUF4114 domain-containing protein [Rhodobacterales bacterium]